MTTLQFIQAKDILSLDKTSYHILDVRTEAEHVEAHLAAPHIFVPLDQLDAPSLISEHNLNGDKPLLILCRSGKRACTAADMFFNAGFENLKVIEGGILACAANGIEVA